MFALENQRLEEVARDSTYATFTGAATTEYSARVFSRYFRGTRCLELGPAEGLMTERLAAHFAELVVVEGSQSFAEGIAQRFPAVEVHHKLFEEFETSRKFDTIVLGHVLEHVTDAQQTLQSVRSWLAPEGRVLAAVPNARSLHRQAAVVMGLLPEEHALNEADRHHGHRRVYDPESLRSDFLAAGFRIEVFGGYWMKPISNSQIERDWTPEMLEAFMQLGERYPDIAGEIYVVAADAS